ncbi:MAG: acylphosphatase [Micromonosporaceae bacterium]
MVKVAAVLRAAAGVLPVGRRAAGGARIAEIRLVRYVGPGRALVHSHGIVAWIRARHGDTDVVGVGEGIATPAQSDAAWRRVQDLARTLVGARLPARVPATDPLGQVDAWRPVRPIDSGAVRAAKLTLEMALLDLLLATGALPVTADPPAPVAPEVVHRLPPVAPGSPRDGLTAVLREAGGAAWAVRLQLTGDTDLDLAWLRHVAAVERERGHHRSLWLVGGDRTAEAAHDFVRRAALLLAAGDLPDLVLLEEPLATEDRSALEKYRDRSALARLQPRSPLSQLQQVADEVLGRGRGGAARGPRLAVVAGASVSTLHQVRHLYDDWPVGGLHLTLPRWGTLVGFQEAARVAKRADPAALVLLGGGRGSRLTAGALEWLAATTPEIDRYVPEPPAVAWPTLAVPRAGDGSGRRTGLCAGVDLAELATVADEVTAVPTPPPPPAIAAPNRFPDHPLPGEAVGRRSMLLETEALRLGLRTRRLSRAVFLAEDPASGRFVGFTDSESSATGAADSVAAARKDVARQLLAAAGLPVPDGGVFAVSDREAAAAMARKLGFPVVVKPAGGSKGVGVTVGVDSEERLARALDDVAASRYADTGVVVERYVAGNDYRVLATRSQVLSVVRREPASVVGDGRRTIEELVVATNAARRQNPHLARRVIRLDARVDETLRAQGLTRWSVPAVGQPVRLRAEANFSLGGESSEVLDETHPSVRQLATAAVRAFPGLPHAGLDILMDDHRLPVDEQTVTVIEVNSRPVQAIHHFPMYGPPREVSARLVRDTVEAAGIRVAEAVDELTVRVTVTGRVQRVGYRRWMVRAARALGVSGWVANAAEPDRVDAVVHGPARSVGMMVRLAFDGPPGAAVVETVAEPVEGVTTGGFRIRRDGG